VPPSIPRWLSAARASAALVAIMAAGFAAAAVLAWTAVTLLPPDGDCDNLAGECLRQRQIGARLGLALVALVIAAAALRGVYQLRRNATGLWRLAIALAVVAAVAAMLIQPAGKLDDRFRGWLSRTPATRRPNEQVRDARMSSPRDAPMRTGDELLVLTACGRHPGGAWIG
jgi:hypothetical protein